MERTARVGIVVPAKDEQMLLPGCLDGLARAAERCPLPVDITIVLDSCVDDSQRIAHRFARDIARSNATGIDVHTVITDRHCVGAARRLGIESCLSRAGEQKMWLATTDADSVVPSDWINAQLAHSDAGATVVLGTVVVGDWDDRPIDVRSLAQREYAIGESTTRGHRHIHGANLSFSAAAYLGVGGFGALDRDEDVALVNAFTAADENIVWATDLPVVTSGRRIARAPSGFAGYLNALSPPELAAESA